MVMQKSDEEGDGSVSSN